MVWFIIYSENIFISLDGGVCVLFHRITLFACDTLGQKHHLHHRILIGFSCFSQSTIAKRHETKINVLQAISFSMQSIKFDYRCVLSFLYFVCMFFFCISHHIPFSHVILKSVTLFFFPLVSLFLWKAKLPLSQNTKA